MNILHRDVKPDNILLNDQTFKLADFGFCSLLRNPHDSSKSCVGSPIYMAPEILKGEEYTIKADVWSLGVVLYELLFGKCPYDCNNLHDLLMNVQKCEVVIRKDINQISFETE